MKQKKDLSFRQRIAGGLVSTLCIAMQCLILIVVLTGMLDRRGEVVDLFLAVDYVVGVFLSFNVTSFLNALFAIGYIFCLGLIVQSLLVSIRAIVKRSKGDEAVVKNKSITLRENFCFSLFFSCLLFLFSSFCGTTTLLLNGKLVLLAGAAVVVVTYVLLSAFNVQGFSFEQVFFDVLRYSFLCLLVYGIVDRLIRPFLESGINGLVTLYNVFVSSADIELWMGWRLFYSSLVEHIFAYAVIVSSIKLLYTIATGTYSTVISKEREAKIKSRFLSVLRGGAIWAIVKCIVNTFFVNKENIPAMSWRLVSEDWFALVRGDLIPVVVFSLVGLLLCSANAVDTKQGEKKIRKV